VVRRVADVVGRGRDRTSQEWCRKQESSLHRKSFPRGLLFGDPARHTKGGILWIDGFVGAPAVDVRCVQAGHVPGRGRARSRDAFDPRGELARTGPEMRGPALRGVIAVMIGAVIGGAVARRGARGDRISIESERDRSPLAPDPAALRYRYPIAAGGAMSGNDAAIDGAGDEATTIAALEARVASLPSPFDMAELAELYLRRATRDGDRRGLDAAAAMAERALAILRTPDPALITLARVASARHDFARAIALAREQLGYKRSSAAYVVLATAQLAVGDLGEAGASASAAIAIKPDTTAYLTRALVRQAQGRDLEAAHDFARAAALEEHGDLEGAAHLRALWGRFLLRRGDVAGARAVLAEALRVAPGFPLAVAQEGELALRGGRARDAVARFDQAFAASRQIRYLIDEGRALELAGDRAAADAVRGQVEAIVRGELGEGGLGHRLDLVEVLVDRASGGAALVEAIALAREEVTRRPSAEVRFQLARALARAGDRDGAAREVDAALASGAREAPLYELAARLAARRGDGAHALLYAGRADRVDPSRSGWRALGMEAP
jgi:Tfp pilus assembly protein PilF